MFPNAGRPKSKQDLTLLANQFVDVYHITITARCVLCSIWNRRCLNSLFFYAFSGHRAPKRFLRDFHVRDNKNNKQKESGRAAILTGIGHTLATHDDEHICDACKWARTTINAEEVFGCKSIGGARALIINAQCLISVSMCRAFA